MKWGRSQDNLIIICRVKTNIMQLLSGIRMVSPFKNAKISPKQKLELGCNHWQLIIDYSKQTLTRISPENMVTYIESNLTHDPGFKRMLFRKGIN